MTFSTSIILHSPQSGAQSSDSFNLTMESILDQFNRNFDIISLGTFEEEDILKNNSIKLQQIESAGKSHSKLLNEAIYMSTSNFIMYIDNREKTVILKKAALDAFLVSAVRNAQSGFFYADYELEDEEASQEVKLLFHHPGRLRDNQDYGKVLFFRKTALEKVSFFDESVEYNSLYDIQLKISEHYDLTRISNKYNGSLYTIVSKGEKVNVFDYLLAGKQVQLEAEEILTSHLKRINAFLKPGEYMSSKLSFKDHSTIAASVIIPVGFRPEFIGTAIESIQAQSIQNIEAIIMVNGGENDPTAEEVRKYMKNGALYNSEKPEIRLLVIDINSIGLCLNMGANMARGKYYVQLDSDDRLKPDAVEKIIECFESSKDIGMVIGSYEVWEKNEEGTLLRMEDIPVVKHEEWTDNNGRNNLLRINGAGAPRAIPIHIIKEMGYFGINDDAFARNYGEDYEMVNKIAECYKIGRIYDPIYEVIRHSGGTDHAISQDVIDRNDEAKDDMRKHALLRRIAFNSGKA